MPGAICRAVRLDGGFRGIVLITAPFLGHNNTVKDQTSIGWRYPRDTLRAGRAFHGWEDIRTATSGYPLSGVGHRLCVDQGRDRTPDDIAARFATTWMPPWASFRVGDRLTRFGWASLAASVSEVGAPPRNLEKR